MPVTTKEKIVFGLIMSYAMAYGMEVYNKAIQLGIAQQAGGFSTITGAVFLQALLETLFMAPVVFLLSSLFGIPVSTTHTKTSAIMGVGAVRRLSAINFGVVRDMMLTWVFTFPGCGLISFVMAKLFMVVF